MAFSRLSLKIEDQGAYPRFTLAVLGVAIPLISAGFFVKGFDAFSKRQALRRVGGLANRSRRRISKTRQLIADQREKILALEKEVELLGNDKHRQLLTARAQHQYRRGYAQGLRDLVTDERGLIQGFRGALVSRSLIDEFQTSSSGTARPPEDTTNRIYINETP